MIYMKIMFYDIYIYRGKEKYEIISTFNIIFYVYLDHIHHLLYDVQFKYVNEMQTGKSWIKYYFPGHFCACDLEYFPIGCMQIFVVSSWTHHILNNFQLEKCQSLTYSSFCNCLTWNS